jgi:hypothetical protein
VGAEEDRASLSRQAGDQLLDDERGVGVEPAERLVEKENFGAMHQRRRDEHFLLHALRVVAQSLIAGARQIDAFEELVDTLNERSRLLVIQRCDQLHVLTRCQRFVERAGLGHVSDPAFHLERIQDDVEAGHDRLAGLMA